MTLNTNIAEHTVGFILRDEATASFFEGFLADGGAEPEVTVESDEKLISLIMENTPEVENLACAEFNALAYAASKGILPFGAVIFHGCAFVWRERAWIFTAPSGTGKTTQYVQWKRRFGGEIEILNGDKPVIAVEDGEVNVYCSPWKGKERMGNLLRAPLGGIIMLAQADENRIQRLGVRACAPYLYRRFVVNDLSADEMKTVCAIEEKMLEKAPVWLLCNRGDIASAELTHEELCRYTDKL